MAAAIVIGRLALIVPSSQPLALALKQLSAKACQMSGKAWPSKLVPGALPDRCSWASAASHTGGGGGCTQPTVEGAQQPGGCGQPTSSSHSAEFGMLLPEFSLSPGGESTFRRFPLTRPYHTSSCEAFERACKRAAAALTVM